MAPGDSEAVAAPEVDAPEAAAPDAGAPQAAAPVAPTLEPPAPATPAEQPALQHPEQPAHDEAATSAHTANGTAGTAPATVPLIESGQIRRALALAQKRTDLNWSVFVGTLGADPRAQAEARHAELGPAAAKSVLIAVDPTAHHLEIVTGAHARKHLDDRSCALAAAAMTSSFAVRDLDGGIANGILALVEHVRSVR